MTRFITLFYFLVFLFEVSAQEKEIKVGLFRASVVNEISIELNEGSQLCLQSNLKIWGTRNRPDFQLSAKDNKIEVYQNSQFLGLFKQIICQSEIGFSVNLRPIKPALKGNKYSGKITISSVKGVLKMINKSQEADYLSGVLRGEVGYDKSNSLYEVHAILSRTYARFYKDRHRSEGFELCDQTHCQVFKGFNDYKPYHQAIYATKNAVVLDSLNGELAELLFHSNCGGQTNASEDVWKTNLTYCRSVLDTFCLKSAQAIWVKQIPLDVFCTKINVNLPSDSISKNSLCDAICSFSQNRPNEIYIGNKKFKMTELRTQLNVKSAWFDWECNGETVYLSGKGFGHGVGMCQEGAIRMSELGFSPSQIIKHYYRNVIIDVKP